MKRVLLALALVLGITSCSNIEAYKGPNYGYPKVTVETRTHWNTVSEPRMPRWETHRMLRFENSTYKNMRFAVDCEWNYFRVDVPARSVARLLITKEDGACDVRRVP